MRFLITLLILAFISPVFGQKVQWASKVIAFSSQFGPKQYSAQQVLGKPNVLPAFRDSPCAWSHKEKESRTDEFIHVAYDNPMQIRQVAVAESHNPGAISRIYVYDNLNREFLVYKNDMPVPMSEDGRMFRVTFALTGYQVRAVKVVLNTLGFPGWSHIDAIGISDSDTPIEAGINLASNVKFEGKPENLGAGINTREDEIMPVISPDGKTLYFDRKPSDGGVNSAQDDIWVALSSNTGYWLKAINLGTPLNNRGHNFLAAISPDGNTALLGNVYEPDGSLTPGLSMSSRTETGWSFPKKLKIKNYYNNDSYSEYHMGADCRTIVMTVNRSDTWGGRDIYVSFLQPDGIWTEPLNLGPVVNSGSDEMSPFLAADGKTLYFSSSGFSGYGHKDMFITRRLDNTWTNWSEPQNLGAGINSPSWDAYYSIPASGEFAYFASENNSIGRTDIFRIKLPEAMRPDPVVLIRGFVENSANSQAVQARIYYEDLATGEEVGEATSSPVTGEYTIILPAGRNYGFRAIAKGFISVNENIDLTEIKSYQEVTKDLALVPVRTGETVVLNNVFFEPSRDVLMPQSYPELNRVAKFLKENPTIHIAIGGHTDNSCEEQRCIELSTARARAVRDYLVKNGIELSRLEHTGYGSKFPKGDNGTAEGKKINRRVEFTVKEM